MKVLLTGCNGLLGQSLVRNKPPEVTLHGLGRNEDPSVTLESYNPVDMADTESLLEEVTRYSPDFIINTAAFTHVDLCEIHPQHCIKVNRDAPVALSKFPMVQISSDYVFDGENGPYKEGDSPNPLSVYGRSKLESEVGVLNGNPRNLVVRTMSLWGIRVGSKISFPDFVISQLTLGKKIQVVSDQIGTPTHVDELAKGLWFLIQNDHSGLFHLTGSELLSRLEWARSIAKQHGLDERLIEPCLTKDLNQKAKRPLKSGLLCDKFMGLK